MGRKLEEILATVVRERFCWGDDFPKTLVLDVRVHPKENGSPVSGAVKVRLDDEEDVIESHLTYRFYGRWEPYTNKRTGGTEQQFVARTFVRARPHGRAGVVRYLTGAPHVGRIIAGRLWEAFQGDAVKVLRRDPEVAAHACRGLSVDGAKAASEWLEREQALEDCYIALTDLLDGRGFPKGVIKQAVKEFGNMAAPIIQRNPYQLMRFRGCGFLRADSLYLDLNYNPARLKRQALCGWYAIAQQRDGSTWHYRAVADSELRKSISAAAVREQAAIDLAKRGGLIAVTRTDGVSGPMDWDGDCEWLAETTKARNEARLAQYVVEAMSEQAIGDVVLRLEAEDAA